MKFALRKLMVVMFTSIVLLSICRLYMTTYMYHAVTPTSSLSAEGEQFANIGYNTIKTGSRTEEEEVNILITAFNSGYNGAEEAANWLVQNGLCVAYIEQFKAAGMSISAGSKGTSSPSAPAAPAAKTEFTVTDVTPYPAWATKDCNIRSGADTTYEKAGGLKKHEQVTVTGQASTGWFRITTADGKEAYISNSLLTTEDPSNREYTTVDNSGAVLTYTFEDTPPEVIDEIIEGIEEKNEAEKPHEHSYKSEITKESTCTEKGVVTYTCDCGDTYTEDLPLAEHTPGGFEVTKKPTLLSAGEQIKKCTVCGEVLETEVIPANTTMLYIIIGAGVLVVAGVITAIVIIKKNR